jgi:ribosomal protein S18 acetylase RimI-like enzyme
MAAIPDAQVPVLLDLWQVRGQDLDDMLEEEVRTWRHELDWDFQPSADLVRRFVDVHALNGYALLIGDEVVGYSYYVCEEHKGLVGDLYLRAEYRTADNEHRLLGAVVEHLIRTPYIRRIESQLMLARYLQVRLLPSAALSRSFERNFMLVDAVVGSKLPRRQLDGVLIDRWTERWQDETATLIASAYRGHIDSEINDQYRSPSGARRFLFNIVQYPGCGTFFEPASCVAVQSGTGRLCGVSLTSMVAQDTGHITQICVSPSVKGQGVGYEMLRHSLNVLAKSGAKKVSLTVTAANAGAVKLYLRMGFRTVRRFNAFVWQDF